MKVEHASDEIQSIKRMMLKSKYIYLLSQREEIFMVLVYSSLHPDNSLVYLCCLHSKLDYEYHLIAKDLREIYYIRHLRFAQ